MKHCITITIIATFFSMSLMAAQGLRDNEDLKFIREYQKEQRIAELAGVLALEPAQIAQLQAMKANVDQIRADYDQKRGQIEADVASTAATIRAELERGVTLSEENRALLREKKQQIRKLRREQKLKVQLATLELGDVLSNEQKQRLRDKRGKVKQYLAASNTEKRMKSEQRRIGRRADKTTGRRGLARVLLTDNFLKHYQ